MSINWYPGHMKKTNEMIRENLKLVDVIIEIIDARIPLSSRNPIIDEVSANKHHIIVMNKSDLADNRVSELWMVEFQKKNIKCVLFNATKDSISKFMGALKEISDEIEQKYKSKGFYNRQIRAMIVGIPNAGKSTFINNISKRKGTATGDKPGVTKSKQWIKVKNNIDMLDTPGILWPKIETDEQGYKLAATGAIREEILNKTDIAAFILDFMRQNYPDNLRKKYNLSEMKDIHEMMNDIGIKNGCLLKGNEIDMERVTRLIISDFRKGRMGKLTMERP